MFNQLQNNAVFNLGNPNYELKLYKQAYHAIDIQFRIHGDEGTLNLLNQIKALHDKCLSTLKQKDKPNIIKITNDIEFEYALQYALS